MIPQIRFSDRPLSTRIAVCHLIKWNQNPGNCQTRSGMRCVSNTIPSAPGTLTWTGPTLHSVSPQTLLCLHSDDPRRRVASAPPVYSERVVAPQPLQKPTGVQHGCGAHSPGAPAQRPALHMRREGQRSSIGCKRGLGDFTQFTHSYHSLQRSRMAQDSESACHAEVLARRLPGADAISMISTFSLAACWAHGQVSAGGPCAPLHRCGERSASVVRSLHPAL